MKWCRFQLGERVSYGLMEDDEVVEVDGSPFGEHRVGRTAVRDPMGRPENPQCIPAHS